MKFKFNPVYALPVGVGVALLAVSHGYAGADNLTEIGDRLKDANTHATAAITEGQKVLEDALVIWGIGYPMIVHALAWVRGMQNIPILGSMLNVAAGNYGHAANAD